MSNVLILAAIVMLVLLFLKVPVYIAVLGGSMVYFVMNPSINAIVFAQQAIVGTEKISLLAIPFFVCAGIFMNYTGVTRRIMDFYEVVTAHLPGGLAQVNVLLSTIMGGLSGSNIADAAMEAKMLVPEMNKKRLLPGVLQRGDRGLVHDHPSDSPGNRHDSLWMYRQCLHRQAVYLRPWSRRPSVHHDDDSGGNRLEEERLWRAHDGEDHKGEVLGFL